MSDQNHNDSWKKYDPDMKEKLKEHPAIINAINTMRDRGFSKERTQKVTGAPYEIVDRLYRVKSGGAGRKDNHVDEED